MAEKKLFTPPFLSTGDKIGIVAPARKIAKDELMHAVANIENCGYRVITGKNLFESDNQFSGTDQQRADDFNQMIHNKEIKAIICARGGYGSVRIIDKIDFKHLKKNPKWIVGYSDITVFHSVINKQIGLETLHAAMPINFNTPQPDNSFNLLIQTLEGKIPQYSFETTEWNTYGKASGIITGGNLSIIYSLRGTPYDLKTRNKILFIEDIDEYLYHIDRMMMNLKTGGMLNSLSGFICGAMTDMKDNTIPFGKTAEEIISTHLSEQHYPKCFHFPAGHITDNFPLIMGRMVDMEINETIVKIAFHQQ